MLAFYKRLLITQISFLLVLFILNPSVIHADSSKIIVGAIETVLISDENLHFVARVDTGAKTSSIHATNITLALACNLIGQAIAFDISNKNGEASRVNTFVDSLSTVRTSEGSELRYKVRLPVTWNGKTKEILFTLNDRSNMQYAVLLGRNWLHGDFIVDVEKNNPD